MGCTSSSESSPPPVPTKSPAAKTEKIHQQRTVSAPPDQSTPTTTTTDAVQSTPEIEKQEADTITLEKKFGNKLRIRYAVKSRKGRDPEDATKANQDCVSVHHNFGDASSDSFFGVYDGHGPTGEVCSSFVKDRLPQLIVKNIQHQNEFVVSTDQIQASLHEAHTRCNEELHTAKHVDDSCSGTTSITMYMEGSYSRITICNVGDSRAVLGTHQKQSAAPTTAGDTKAIIKAVPLSKDQTPHRADEAQRCIRHGARILTFGQVKKEHNTANNCTTDDDDDDSETEDPPRVWAKHGKYPGTAFTRSLGDAVAETLGVFGEPEMLTLRISSKEKVIVLASDGVFDVMSNQQVVDMCFQYYHDKDPSQACSAVIDHSHKEWLIAEECADEDEKASYDDMTMACVFVYDEDEMEDEVDTMSDGHDASDEPDADSIASKPTQRRKRVKQKTLRNLDEL